MTLQEKEVDIKMIPWSLVNLERSLIRLETKKSLMKKTNEESLSCSL